MAPDRTDGDHGTRLRARAITYGLSAAMIIVGVTQTELWPLTSFRLFSGIRGAETTSWQVVAVDGRGVEHALVLPGPDEVGLPHHVLPRLVGAPLPEQQEVVWAYVDAASPEAAEAMAARVYRITSLVSSEPGTPREVIDRDLAYEVTRP